MISSRSAKPLIFSEGQFLDTLPADSPKDPFTGQDYHYVQNQDGFVLIWDEDNVSVTREKYRRYEFNMPRQNLGTAE